MLTWTCNCCGEERPDIAISVRTTDRSAEYGFPPGTLRENVRYCNDRPACIEASKTKRLLLPASELKSLTE